MKTSPDSSPQNALSNTPKSNRKSFLRWIFRLILGGAIVFFLASRHDFSALTRGLRAVPLWIPLASVAFYWLGQALCAWKWQLLLRAQGAEVSFRDCCRFYAVGMFWNLWMPTNIGGDAVRALRCAPFCGGKIIATSSVLLDRLSGLAALLTIALGGILVQWFVASPLEKTAFLPVLRPIFLVFCALVFASALLLRHREKSSASDTVSPLRRKLRAFADALAVYSRPESRGVLWRAFALSLLFQGSQILLNIGLARAIGLGIPTTTFWWLVPSLAIASLVPLGIGGLGVREAAAVSLLNVWPTPAATIVAWSLLWQATIWLASLPGALWTTQRTPNPGKCAGRVRAHRRNDT